MRDGTGTSDGAAVTGGLMERVHRGRPARFTLLSQSPCGEAGCNDALGPECER